MIEETSAGHSAETARKQEHFRYFLQIHLRVVRAILCKSQWASPHYVYIDLTAGPGVVQGKEGSPLIFVDEAENISQPWRAFFCERSIRDAQSLRVHLQSRSPEMLTDSNCYSLYATDHGAKLGEIADGVAELRKPAFGLIYADPNGSYLPVDAVRMLVDDPAFAKVDVLYYVAAASYKRFRCAFENRPFLREDLERTGKRYIYVRKPYAHFQWAFVFLTNWSGYPEIKKLGFHRIDTPSGATILDQLDRTTEERAGQQEIDL